MEIAILRFSIATAVLTVPFWTTGAWAQALIAPPNETRTNEAFSSTTTSTVVANAAGQITLTGGSVTLDAVSPAGQAAGLLANGAGATITATGVAVTNNNLQGSSITFGVNATSTSGAATVTLNGGPITTSALAGGRAFGINSAVGGTVDATDVAITTESTNSHAVVAAGGDVTLTGGSITTLGTFSLGLQANSNAGPASITVNGTAIDTSGNTSAGATAERSTGSNPATISLTDATINTIGMAANGLVANGSGNSVTAVNTNITTSGPSAAGAVAFNGAQIHVEGGAVSSTQSSTIVAASASLITLSGGTVTLNAASGGQIAGLSATGDQARITATNVDIENNNNQHASFTFGVDATSTPGAAVVTLNGGTITTSALAGGRAFGINSAVGGTVDATDVAITTESLNSHAVVAAGGDVTLTGGSITTLGTFSLGLQANSNAGPASITVNGTTIDTLGNTSAGATATGSQQATISLSNASITTSGAAAPGVRANGAGSYILDLNNTSINTASSDAILADAARLADINITNVNNTIHAGSGNLLNVITGSNATLNVENSTLSGNILTDSSSTLEVNVGSGSTLIIPNGGTLSATGTTLANGGTLAIPATYTLTSATLTSNGGAIRTLANTTFSHDVTVNTGGVTLDSNGFDSTFSGVFSGDGALTKAGEGRITLTGVNSYSGGTFFSGGILAVAGEGHLGEGPLTFNGGTLEDLTGANLVEDENIELDRNGGGFIADNGTTSSLSGVISGPGRFTKEGAGTLILNGANLFTGGMFIDDGILIVGVPTALGLGDVFLEGGTLRTTSLDPLTIQIAGNYTQGSGGTLALGVGGTNPSDFDRLEIRGNASLSGTLSVFSLNNFRPAAGDAFEIIHTGGARSGQFATINDALNNNPSLERVNVYAPNGVALVYIKGSGPPIDEVEPEPLPPVEPGEPVPEEDVVQLIDFTAEQFTSLFEISFSGANSLRFNLDDRMTQIQQGSTGFVSPISPAPPPSEPKATIGEGKGEGKAVAPPPVFQPTPQNRWGVWVNGWGDFVSIDNDNFAKGYNFTTGGVSTGLDYRITDHFALGIFGSYAHTWTSLQPSGNIDVDTGRGGLYATYFDHGFYLNTAAFGAYNSYDTRRQGLLGAASGSSDGYEFSTFLDAGYNFSFGNFTVGPTGAVQYTNVHVNGFSEHGSLIPLQVHSDSEESWRTDLGLQASYTCHVGNVLVIPSVTAAWEHEFKYSALPITVSAPALGGATTTFFGPNQGHDSAIINAGVGVQLNQRISVYVGYQGQVGRKNYDANGVTGTIGFSF